MVRKALWYGAVAVMLCGAVSAQAGEPTQEEMEARKCKAIPNLLIAIQSDNPGLQESAAYLLGEFKCEKAVIPLMAILRGSDRESARDVAALALCRIGDERGIYAVKRAVTFDGSSRVRARCAWFYNRYVEDGTFAFHPSESGLRQIATR
jgi:HEAT repeat protein